jgi:hypothetical protein
MTRPRNRQFVPQVIALEGRSLLSGTPTAIWIGQDGQDLAGGATPLAGNGVQDIHIELTGLPTNKSIDTIYILGYGGGGWVVNIGPYAPYDGVLEQSPGSSTADLYVDPYQTETGRQFTLTITYSDQSTAVITMNGGTADPNLRTPADAVAAQWLGQDGHDLTGPSPAVGPDGYQDVHLTLTHLFPGASIAAVTVTDALGDAWASGTNPNVDENAEFLPDPGDATRGDLYFSPTRDLNGQTLTVTVTYADGKLDHTTLTAGPTNPNLPMPAPAPVNVNWSAVQAQWLGQDGFVLLGQGDVHLTLTGLPAGRTVVSATLSDQSGDDWSYTRPGSGATAADPSAMALGFQAGSDPTRADLAFQPVVNETGATLTLVLTLDDGSILAARLAGGACDPGLRAPGIAPTSVIAHPGDDLNVLANSYGTVRLVSGLYPMDKPLVLNHPVTITADPGTILLFSQGPNDPTWTAAIKVRASHTTLSGFAVRFAGPVRWNPNVNYGPAVIGWTDNLDPWSADPGVDLTFTNLDVQSPPASTSWEEAPHTFRLVGAESGLIADNRIKGGMTELEAGPWQVTGNDYLGTLPDTYALAAFGTHYTRDLTLSDNLVEPTGPSGKTWRFLVMTQEGVGDVVSDNTVIGVGPMDSDTVPNPNASEVILTEAYTVHYEGMVSSVSPDGLLVQIPSPQGSPARTGDVVAILSGPQAGQLRTIAQVLSPTTYLLDSPLTPGRFAVSLDTGFVGETFQGNTVNCLGSSTALDLVLVGNQFGLNVLDNTFVGGGYGFKITACPSESPEAWGWTHDPLLGATIEGNTIEDTQYGGILDVEHSQYTKSNAGRVYFSGSFLDNTGVWTAPIPSASGTAGSSNPPTLVTVGDALSADPGELVLTESGNQVNAPASVGSEPTFQVVSGTINGQAVRDTGYVLSGVSASPDVAATSVPPPAPSPPPAPAAAPQVVIRSTALSTPAPAAPAVPVAPVTVDPAPPLTAAPCRKPTLGPIPWPVFRKPRASSTAETLSPRGGLSTPIRGGMNPLGLMLVRPRHGRLRPAGRIGGVEPS